MQTVLVVLLLLTLVSMAHSASYFICEAGDEILLGEYVQAESEEMDGAPVYSNGNDMSLFRNKGFWYIGNLG